ncbi:uncharacterized protein TEOVI_000458400 [Trypanosoma equiperdum]|uniref:Uncharacterized protein n=1 Tax=Trypanosoma equiperdum TaxID=5694 RepID=A0A1G4IKS3_TRYEQ|nr:hypothetical protein, conserved [Trypanosoma equiperdum]
MSTSFSSKKGSITSESLAERETTISLVPPKVLEELRVLKLLRQELRNTHENPDASSEAAVSYTDPLDRTLDAKSLNVLKLPTFPFIVCESAPSMYQTPIPYDVEKAVAVLQDEVYALESKFRDIEDEQGFIAPFCEESSLTSREDGADSLAISEDRWRKDEKLRLFMEVAGSDTCFADVSWDISVMRWYTRWITSHSLSCLREVRDQLEYVLSEFGVPGEREIRKAVARMTFAEAVYTLEQDRDDVIEFERRRMASAARTYRKRLTISAVTACSNSFLTLEERYLYQEFYDQSEHALQLLHHAMHMCSTLQSCGSTEQQAGDIDSARNVSPSKAVSCAPSCSDTRDVWCLTEAAMKTLKQEQNLITRLLGSIHSRQEGSCLKVELEKKRRRSRIAALVVYKCVVDDMEMLSRHVKVATDLLRDYDGWVNYRSGISSHDIILQMNVNQRGNGETISRQSGCSSPPVMNPDIIGCRLEFSHSGQFQPGRLPRHVEEVCRSFIKLIKLVCDGADQEGGYSIDSTTYRRWSYLALRYTCIQIVRGRWPSTVILESHIDIARVLPLFLLEHGSDDADVHMHVKELSSVLQCFLSLVKDGKAMGLGKRESASPENGSVRDGYPTTSTMRFVDIPVPIGTVSEINAADEASLLTDCDSNVWKWFYEAMLFQIDPTGDAHGGYLLSSDFTADTSKGFHYVRLGAVTLPHKSPRELLHGAQESLKLHINLHYVVHPNNTAPARSLAQILEEGASPSSVPAFDMLRYGYARRTLHIMTALEKQGMLKDYACAIPEVKLVPLADIVFFSRYMVEESSPDEVRSCPSSSRSGRGSDVLPREAQKMITAAGLLPPAAVQLMRHNTVNPSGFPLPPSNEHPSMWSLNLLIGNMLMHVATCARPMLSEMYEIGERACNKGLRQAVERNDLTYTDNVVKKHHNKEVYDGSVVSGRGCAEEQETPKDKDNFEVAGPILRSTDEYMLSTAFERTVRKANIVMQKQNQSHLIITPRSSIRRSGPWSASRSSRSVMEDKDLHSPSALGLGSLATTLRGRFSLASPKVLFSQRSGNLSPGTRTVVSERTTKRRAQRAVPRLS